METQNNQNQNNKTQSVELQMTDIVFYEFGIPRKNHVFTVLQSINGAKKEVVARVYRDFIKETGKYQYTSLDTEDKEVFPVSENVFSLKKQFVKRAQELTQSITVGNSKEEPPKELPADLQKYQREEQLKEFRERKNTAKNKNNDLNR